MAKALAVARTGFRRLFSISAFTPPPPATVPPAAEPSPNLFVSGLSKRTTSEGLREAFSKFGNVVQARVVTDRVSGYSKGFGFVRYATIEAAAEGIKGMDGKFLDGWVIFAEYARPRPPPSSQAQPSNYTSPTSPSWSGYQPSQPSEPVSSHSSYAPQETQTPSKNYSYQSAQTWRTPPNNNSVPSSNYSSETPPSPSGFASVQASNYSKSQLEYASGSPLGFTPRAPPTFNFPPQASNPENSSIEPSSYLHQ